MSPLPPTLFLLHTGHLTDSSRTSSARFLSLAGRAAIFQKGAITTSRPLRTPSSLCAIYRSDLSHTTHRTLRHLIVCHFSKSYFVYSCRIGPLYSPTSRNNCPDTTPAHSHGLFFCLLYSMLCFHLVCIPRLHIYSSGCIFFILHLSAAKYLSLATGISMHSTP